MKIAMAGFVWAVWPRRVCWGVCVLLLLSLYQCGEVPVATEPHGRVVAAAAKTVAADSVVAGLVVSAEVVDVGDEFEIEVFVDLSGSDAALGAYQARLSWDTAVLSVVEVSDGSTAAFAGAYRREEAGALVFSQFNAQGADGRVSLLRVRFSVVGSGSSGLGVGVFGVRRGGDVC